MNWDPFYIAFLGVLLAIVGLFLLNIRKTKISAEETNTFHHYQRLLDSFDHPCYITRNEFAVLENKSFIKQSFTPHSIVGSNVWERWGNTILKEVTYPTFIQRLRNNEFQELRSTYEAENETRHILIKASPIEANRGLALIQIIDETIIRLANLGLEEGKLLLDRAQGIAEFGYWHAAPTDKRSIWSTGMNEIFGLNTPALINEYQNRSRWSLFHSADLKESQQVFKSIYNDDTEQKDWRFRIIRPDGQLRHVKNKIGVLKDVDGKVIRIVGVIQDITQSIQNEDRLRHAQKMEAVGQLTGGLSHDFNNLLHVILGNAELLPPPADRDDQDSLNAIKRAARRGSELTQRLLAFSRKQHLDPKSINVNTSIKNMLPMLRRTLGETFTINSTADDNLMECKVDIGQLESTILNLTINARHAMSKTGELNISTANTYLDETINADRERVKAGKYVMITMSDTGHGMSQEILERIFEPFFTTREVGEGSGLGLSMVYGFIRQSDGHITVSSQEGVGTTIKLYLPESTSTFEDQQTLQKYHSQSFQGKVLLVEDDRDVSTLTRKFLESVGLRVITARNVEEAMRAVSKHPNFVLLLCDVVLPGGTNGPDIANLVTEALPGIKVLFMSGYTKKEILAQGIEEAEVSLLQKPFQKVDLIKKLNEELNLV